MMKKVWFWTLIFAFLSSLFFSGCGPQSRKMSRLTGKPLTLELPEDCVEVVSVSISAENGGNSTKNITYVNRDGDLITREYTDWGIWEGSIRWVRHDGSPYAPRK